MSENTKLVRKGNYVMVPLVGRYEIEVKKQKYHIDYNVIIKLDLTKKEDRENAISLVNDKKLLHNVKKENYIFVGSTLCDPYSKIDNVIKNTSFNSTKNTENLLSLYCITYGKPLIFPRNTNQNTELRPNNNENNNQTIEENNNNENSNDLSNDNDDEESLGIAKQSNNKLKNRLQSVNSSDEEFSEDLDPFVLPDK